MPILRFIRLIRHTCYVFIHLVKEMVPPKGQPFLVPLFHQPPVTDLFSLGETTDRCHNSLATTSHWYGPLTPRRSKTSIAVSKTSWKVSAALSRQNGCRRSPWRQAAAHTQDDVEIESSSTTKGPSARSLLVLYRGNQYGRLDPSAPRGLLLMCRFLLGCRECRISTRTC